MQDAEAKKKKSRTVVISACVAAGLAAVVFVWGFVLGIKRDLEPGDETRVLTAEAFLEHAQWEDEIDPSRLAFTRRLYLGSHDLEYDYAAPGDEWFVYNLLTHETSEKDARTTYGIQILTSKLMDGEIDMVDAPTMISGPDQASAWWMVYEGRRTGFMAVMREDAEVLTVTVTGVELQDGEPQAMLQPVIDRLGK